MTQEVPAQTAATLRMVDPTTLVVTENVRRTVSLGKQFVASIKAHGVLQAITAVEAEDGTLAVRFGQRRTLAAIEAGVEQVPVMVVTAIDDEAARIVEQLGENDHRDRVTEGDRRAAYEQLTVLGLSANQIARRTGRPRAEVEHATTANQSDLAKKAVDRYDFLTLEDAALIAEFEDDTETVMALVAAAKNGESRAHVAQRARDERAAAEAKATAEQALQSEGVTLIDRPSWDERTITTLKDLRASADASAALSPTEHRDCPGHAAYVERTWSSETVAYRPAYVCTAPKQHGHVKVGCNGQPTTTGGGPMTEAEKAERKRVIENNKAWDSAVIVRREWLALFTQGTAAPQGAEQFVAEALAAGESATDIPYDQRPTYREKARKASPKSAVRLAACLLVLAWDAKTGRHTWRNPTEKDRRYMAAIVAWGYQPSDVERLLLPEQG